MNKRQILEAIDHIIEDLEEAKDRPLDSMYGPVQRAASAALRLEQELNKD